MYNGFMKLETEKYKNPSMSVSKEKNTLINQNIVKLDSSFELS